MVAQMRAFMGDDGAELVVVKAVDEAASNDDQGALVGRAAGERVRRVRFEHGDARVADSESGALQVDDPPQSWLQAAVDKPASELGADLVGMAEIEKSEDGDSDGRDRQEIAAEIGQRIDEDGVCRVEKEGEEGQRQRAEDFDGEHEAAEHQQGQPVIVPGMGDEAADRHGGKA